MNECVRRAGHSRCAHSWSCGRNLGAVSMQVGLPGCGSSWGSQLCPQGTFDSVSRYFLNCHNLGKSQNGRYMFFSEQDNTSKQIILSKCEWHQGLETLNKNRETIIRKEKEIWEDKCQLKKTTNNNNNTKEKTKKLYNIRELSGKVK